MKLADQILENKIQHEAMQMLAAVTKDDMRIHEQRMRELIAMRSAEYVREMERQKGLRQ